jgi:glucan phosphoethanolaminetransferase (alkaline phosphatase superfamily)
VHSVSSRRLAFQAAAFSAAHLLAALFAAVPLSSYAHFGRRGLLFHVMLLVAGIGSGWVAVLFRFRGSHPPANTARVVFASLATAATCLLIVLYAGTYIGNREWGAGLNYRIVLGYASMVLPDRPPLYVRWSVALSALAAVAALFVLYWWSWRLVATTARTMAPSIHPRALIGGTVAWIAATAMVGVWFAQTGAFGREPIAGFFFTSDEEYDFSQYSLDRQLAADAIEARASYPHGQTFTRRNVILIVVDALRADHMGVYGYGRDTTPFLSSLASSRRLQKVELALSSCAESSCGITSLLSSKSFRHLSVPNFSLGGLLQDQGYAVYQILSADHTFAGVRKAYGAGQTLYFDSASSRRYPMNDDGVAFEGLEKVPHFTVTPALLHFHLMSVHFAGVKHEAFRRFQPWFVRQDFASIVNSTRDLVALMNNYDNGVLEADDTIRRLFDALDRKGYLANSIVVITADHGEGLGDRDPGPEGLGHVHSLHQEFVRIPMLVSARPDVRYANLQFATQVDVAPTIVDTLGLPVPPSWEGRSLRNPVPREYSFLQTSRWTPCYGVVERTTKSTTKYIRCDRGHTELLYDLDTDPMERTNLLDTTDQATLARLRGRLQNFLSEARPPAAKSK